MLTSPYPVPADRVWRLLMIAGWLFGVGGGVWVLVYPPQSYEGLTAGLSFLWGALLIAGSLGVLAGHVLRRHRIEKAGLWPALGGTALYAALSWESALTDSPGSGPRACLMILLLCVIAARLRQLARVEKRVNDMDKIARGS